MYDDFTKKDSKNIKVIYIIGSILGVIVTLISMLIFAGILLLFNIDRAYATPFATISVAVGCFVASLYTSKKIKDKGYLIGLIIGSVVFLVITVFSIIMGNALTINTAFHFIIMVLSSIVGGIIGVNSNKHKKYI